MFQATYKALRRLIGLEDITTPKDVHAVFVLRYDGLEIGSLTLDGGKWTFRYSQAFREQSAVLPLVDFPDKERVYVHDDLWPFFLSRIPSIAQPEVLQVVEREHIDARNPVVMLKRFGERTISNPFILVEAA